jgi:hypothetical protein
MDGWVKTVVLRAMDGFVYRKVPSEGAGYFGLIQMICSVARSTALRL